jgi:hypothetical protein
MALSDELRAQAAAEREERKIAAMEKIARSLQQIQHSLSRIANNP